MIIEEKNLKKLLDQRDSINDQISVIMEDAKGLQDKLNKIEDQIEAVIKEPVKQARAIQAKDTGTIDVLVQGVMVKHAVQKKVDWDQEKLADVWGRIMKAGDNPLTYMKRKETFSVAEKTYQALAPEIRRVFEPARTVKPGVVKVSFDRDWRK